MTLRIEAGKIVREVVDTEEVNREELAAIEAQLVRRLAQVRAELAEYDEHEATIEAAKAGPKKP